MDQVNLKWVDLKHYSSLSDTDKQLIEIRSGIYIWGFCDNDNQFWPYYVGKHFDIPHRLCEHLSSILGGLYQVYSVDQLFNVPRDKSYYSKDSINNWLSFIKNNTINTDPHASEMIKRFHYTYALLPDFYNKGEDAEKFILGSISRKVLINKRFGQIRDKGVLFSYANLFEVINPQWKAED